LLPGGPGRLRSQSSHRSVLGRTRVRGRSGLVAASRAAGHDLLHCCRSRPWFNMIRYFGVLSSHSRHRARVVPSRVDPARFAPEPAEGDQLEFAFPGHAAPTPTRGRSRWGWLLRHVFRAQVETCRRCGGPMRWESRQPPNRPLPPGYSPSMVSRPSLLPNHHRRWPWVSSRFPSVEAGPTGEWRVRAERARGRGPSHHDTANGDRLPTRPQTRAGARRRTLAAPPRLPAASDTPRLAR
jgi:hypothetical protein